VRQERRGKGKGVRTDRNQYDFYLVLPGQISKQVKYLELRTATMSLQYRIFGYHPFHTVTQNNNFIHHSHAHKHSSKEFHLLCEKREDSNHWE
jgi:hypothetical protein